MELHIRHNVPMLLVGDTGTGKSFYVWNMLMNQLSEQDYVPAFITFTAQTTANQTQVWQDTKDGQVSDLIARNRYPFFNPFSLSHTHTPTHPMTTDVKPEASGSTMCLRVKKRQIVLGLFCWKEKTLAYSTKKLY